MAEMFYSPGLWEGGYLADLQARAAGVLVDVWATQHAFMEGERSALPGAIREGFPEEMACSWALKTE